MKNLIMVMLLLSIIIGCSSPNNKTTDNLALVEKYESAVEDMNYEAMETLLADTYLGLGPSYGDSIGKSQAIENWKNNVETLYEKIKYHRTKNVAVTIDSGPNKGEWVSNWAELNISYKDGRGPITIWSNSIYQIENDQIIKSFTFYNEADALRQLGYVFINPNDL